MPTNPQSEVKTRKATDEERQPGAKIEVGKATEPMPGEDSTVTIQTGDVEVTVKPGSESGGNEAEGETPKDETPPEAPKSEAPKSEGDEPDEAKSAHEALVKEYEDLRAQKSLNAKQSKRLQELRTQLGQSGKSGAYDKAAANDKTGAKAKSTTTTPKAPSAKELRYQALPWLKDAVANARRMVGKKPDGKGGTLGDKTVEYAGPIQHVKVRNVGELLLKEQKKPVTAENILALTGLKSAAKLKALAEFEADKSELAPLAENFGKLMKNPGKGQKADQIKDWRTATGNSDGWATGRYLAAIFYVWIDEKRKEAAAAKRDSAKKDKQATAKKDTAKGNGAKGKTPAAA